MAYQSLYRKYRPQRFSELVGQEHVVTALQNAVRDGRVGHAYLFSGPRGTGKTTTARLLAKALNCTNRGDDGDPCGVCESCVAIAEGSSLDVIEVDAASKSRVEEMRDLLERVAYLSAGGAKKVYILDEVHMLSASAEAALLKTLEESPEHVVFVLATTDPLKVAPTIRSRTQHYEFTLYTVDQLVGHLADVCEQEGVDADREALTVIARAGAGSMRDSLSLLDQAIAHGAIDVEQVNALFGGTAFAGRLAILRAVADEDVAGALVALGELLDAGHEPRRLTEDLLATVARRLPPHVGAWAGARRPARRRPGGPGRAGGAGGRPDARPHARDARTGGRRHAGDRCRRPAPRVGDRTGQAGPPGGRHADAGAGRARRAARARGGRRGDGSRGDARGTTPTSPAAPERAAADAPAARSGRSFAELRRQRAAAPAVETPTAVAAPEPEPEAEADPAASEPAGEVDIDDVIVAWAEILDDLPPATKAAVREAQPLAIDDGVITFGVPDARYDVAVPRFKKEADNIRSALSSRLGRQMRFKPVPHDGFDADPVTAPEPLDEEPPDDEEMLDLAEMVADDATEVPAVDSVSLITQSLGATVVEEVPRD